MSTMTIARGPDTDEAPALGLGPGPRTLSDGPIPDAEALIKEARRRQRRRWALGALALGLVGGLVTGIAVSSGAPPPRTPRAHPADTPSAPAVSLSALPWPARLVASTGHVRSMVTTTGDLYWLTGPAATGCGASAAAPVPVRFDPTTGAKVRGAPLAACTQAIAAADGSLWALEPTWTSSVVASLDPRTLAVTASLHFPRTTADQQCAPEACGALAGGPGPVLWVSNGAEIWRVDAASGAVEGSFPPVSAAAELAPGPTGQILYTSGANPSGGGAAIDEYAAASGTLLGRAAFPQCLETGPAQLAAGPADVWVSCRSGMAGSASELSSTGLASVQRPVTPTGSNGPFLHMMGVTVGTSGGPLWLSSIGDLACADPATGALRGRETLPVPFAVGSPVAIGGHLYGELDTTGVVSVSAPSACFGG